MSEDLPASDAPRTLDYRLNWLFETIRPAVDDNGNRVPYSQARRFHNYELAAHLGVTPSYVSQLKKGKKPNPTVDVLRKIADFFDVPVTYFVSDATEAARVETAVQYKVDLRRFQDGELSEPPVDPASSGPHRQLPGEMPDTSRPVCERLNWLFENVQSAQNRRPYSEDEVAEAIGEKVYRVKGLRTGDITDADVPAPVLRKLAAFFGKPLSYLYADEQDAATDDTDDVLVGLIEQFDVLKEGLVKVATRRLGASSTGARREASRRVFERLLQSHLVNEAQQAEAPFGTPGSHEAGQ